MRTLAACILSVLTCLSQAQDISSTWLEGLNAMAPIYEKNADPYFKRFAQQVYPPGTDGKLIDAQYRIYKQQSEELTNDLRSAIKEKKNLFAGEYSKQQLLNLLAFTYRNNFPGLDYEFFEKAGAEAGKK